MLHENWSNCRGFGRRVVLCGSRTCRAALAEAFGALPLAETGRLSPGGKYLAVIHPIKGRDGVMIYDLSSPAAKPDAGALDEAAAGDSFWKTNDRLICVFALLQPKYRSSFGSG